MKTIYSGTSGKDQKIRKALVNRSRSGNLFTTTPHTEQLLQSPPPSRNCLGLKNYEKHAFKKPGQVVKNLNEDYFQIPKTVENKKKGQKKSHNILMSMIKKQQKQINEIQFQQESESQIKQLTTPATTQNSKISNQIESKTKQMFSEYLGSIYLSPSSKLKNLQKQRNIKQQKLLQNLQKIIKKQQNFKQKKNKFQLQQHMYQKIIANLKQQVKLAKTSIFSDEKLHEKLKMSGALQTQEDDNSNQF